LAARLEDRDSESFVGRVRELALLERCLDDDPPASVVLVHGPGGIGKSTLLRELARRAAARGWEIFAVEGRDLAPTPDALEALLGGARDAPMPLVLIDTFERMEALGGYLRRGLLPSLPERTVVVIAGRSEPDAAWFQAGWETLATELALGAFGAADALALVEVHGVDDERAQAIIDWAAGSPLAIALAAEAAAADAGWSPEQGSDRPEILHSLIRRLLDTELGLVGSSALLVAAIARVTTTELLRAVLPKTDADAAFQRLRSLSFTEPLGDGLALHELVRRTLRADFCRRDAERERELRRRIVDHLYERACAGEPALTIDMAHLVENPAIRWGYGWDAAPSHRIDNPRPGDAESVAAQLDEHGLGELWPLARPFFEDAPERVAVVRDLDDNVCAYLVSMTQANAPPFADEDPIVGPWLAQARADAHRGDSVLWHDSIDFDRSDGGRVKGMLGMAGILRSGCPNPRYAYLPVNPVRSAALAFARSVGAQHLAHLDAVLATQRLDCHRIDWGPGGLLAAQRALVYAELGLAAPAAQREPAVSGETVRDALRNFRLPLELARSPLARGAGAEQRAESVRELLRDASERAFGDTDNERLMRRVLVRGYLEPSSSHEQAAVELSLSRAAYFRRLRVAAERVAEYVVGAAEGS
jgi:AAA ATPase domain